jgi:hypothetical protein
MCKLRRRHTRIALFLESRCGKLEHAQVATATRTCKARICKNEGAHESVNVLRCNQKYMGPGITGEHKWIWPSLTQGEVAYFPDEPHLVPK